MRENDKLKKQLQSLNMLWFQNSINSNGRSQDLFSFNSNSFAYEPVYFAYLVFIESITMAPRDPNVQSQCMEEQPYARTDENLL